MSMIFDGYTPNCLACGSSGVVNRIDGTEICARCQTNQDDYKIKSNIKHLIKYGFTKVEVYEKQNIFQKMFKFDKVLSKTYYTFNGIKAYFNDTGLDFYIDNKLVSKAYRYCDQFKYFEMKLNVDIEPYLRKLKLKKLKNINYE